MPGQSVFPRLEPFLPQVQKPIQYVGGELNSSVKPWEERRRPLGADVPRRLRGRAAQPGRHDPVRGAQRAARRAGRAHLRVWPDLAALDARGGRARSSPSTGTARWRPSTCSGVSFSTELGYTNMLERARPGRHPAATRRTAPTSTRSCSPAGTPRSTPSRSREFLDAAVLGDGEQAVLEITEVIRQAERAAGRAREELLLRLAAHRRGLRARASTTSTTSPTAGSRRVVPNRPDVPFRVQQAHRHGPRRVAVPEDAAGAARRDRARADERGDLPRLHPRLPVLPGRHDHPPGARALDHRDRRDGRARPGRHRLRGGRPARRCPAPTTPRSPTSTKGLADRYEGTQTSLSLPSTRVDAFNIDLAHELSRNGRRSGLTFAPEGGCERLRRVINKMVSKDDLIRTVAAAYAAGWRQVKLYFMCGLPDRDRRGRPRDRRDGPGRHPGRPAGHRARATSAAPCRSAASCPSRTPRSSGPRRPTTRRPTGG